MSGKELLEGMSYVEEKYIEEAEKQFLHRPVQRRWVRWTSLAACLCIGFLGMYTVRRIGEYPEGYSEENGMQKEEYELTGGIGLTEKAGFDDGIETAETFGSVMDMQIAESITEPEAAKASQSVKNEAEMQEEEKTIPILLLVDAVTESGFRGIVAEAAEGTSLVTGIEVNVVLQTNIRGEGQSDPSVPELEAALAMDDLSGSLVEVAMISYDKETATLVVKEMKKAE